MLRTIGRLLVVLLSFVAAACIVALFPPLITYKWDVARTEVYNISRRVTDACRILGEAEVSADAVNDWLAGKLPSDHPLAKEMGESPHKDPWENLYRCIRFVHSDDGEARTLGVYSMGRDGVSETDGNDTDDLNSWNSESHQWYIHDIKTQRLREGLTKAVLLTPIVYFVVVGIGWLGMLPLKMCRTKR
jgi:hypothetical protein